MNSCIMWCHGLYESWIMWNYILYGVIDYVESCIMWSHVLCGVMY